MNVKNWSNASPAWVTKFVAASTLFLQGLPPMLQATQVIDQHTKDVISLSCDVLNLAVAGVAIFFGGGNSKSEE